MKIEPGQLVVVNVEKAVSPENLSLSPTTKHGIILYEEIDLLSFPSYRDFKGYNKTFNKEILLVVSIKGRPHSFNREKHWDIYNVYQLLHNGKTYECFSYCLESLPFSIDFE